MSRCNPQEYVVLNDRKFEEMCSILGIKQQCCLDPDRKVIEKAFRRSALKCHPDKGGDPVVFKKLNDAYYKLIGHIRKVDTLLLTFVPCIHHICCYKRINPLER